MSEKRFELVRRADCPPLIYDKFNDSLLSVNDAVHQLNLLQKEVNNLHFRLRKKGIIAQTHWTCLLIC